MLSDEELLAQMQLVDEGPEDPRHRKIVKPKYAKSIFQLEDLKAKCGERVWIKCITDVQPWADGHPLQMWKEYLIPINEAIMLDERRFAVILHSQVAFKELPTITEEPKEIKEESKVITVRSVKPQSKTKQSK